MERAAELVEMRRKSKVSQLALSMALGISKTTLVKREVFPGTAPEGWWVRYETTLRGLVTTKARETLELVA